jgi:hypothetical protein
MLDYRTWRRDPPEFVLGWIVWLLMTITHDYKHYFSDCRARSSGTQA